MSKGPLLCHGQDDGLYCPECGKSVYLESREKPNRWKQVYSYRCHACRGLLDMHFSLDEEGMAEGKWGVFRYDVPLPPGEDA